MSDLDVAIPSNYSQIVLQNPILQQIYQPFVRNTSLETIDLSAIICPSGESKLSQDESVPQSSVQHILSEMINNSSSDSSLRANNTELISSFNPRKKSPQKPNSVVNQRSLVDLETHPESVISNLSPVAMDTDSENEAFLKHLFS